MLMGCAAGDAGAPSDHADSGADAHSAADASSSIDAPHFETGAAADAGDSAADAEDTTYSISAMVSGLAGLGLVLQDNKVDHLAVTANGKVTFKEKLRDASGYAVTIATQPASPTQMCVVINGNGSVAGGNVSNIEVACTTNTYSISGTIQGLAGSGLVLQNDGADDLSITVNGAFTFATPIASGDAYDVTVKTQPDTPIQSCSVSAGNGTVVDHEVTTVVVDCAASP